MSGPEIIYCHDEIAYHFARDSLVYVPSDQMLPWLPANFVFTRGERANGAADAAAAPALKDPLAA